MSGFLELKRNTKHSIFAIPFRDGRPLESVRLPEGTIVEAASPAERGEFPCGIPGCFEVGHGGIPATSHHANLGLILAYLPISGFFRFPDGGLVAVYGAEAVPIAAGQLTVD
jgi:hypothetical protein